MRSLGPLVEGIDAHLLLSNDGKRVKLKQKQFLLDKAVDTITADMSALDKIPLCKRVVNGPP